MQRQELGLITSKLLRTLIQNLRGGPVFFLQFTLDYRLKNIYIKYMIKKGCKKISEELEESLRNRVIAFTKKYARKPHLAVIQVKGNVASDVYVRKKTEMCANLGIQSTQLLLENNITEEELISKIEGLNKDDGVDGILVQLPLPSHIDESRVIDTICIEKDVDGFSKETTGLISQNRSSIYPCTPYGILYCLKYWNVPLESKRAVVVGRSSIVGKPISYMLTNENATVTLCHSKTSKEDLKRYCLDADIIVIVVGAPRLIDSSYVKEGAWVIDVGVNRIEDASKEKGYRLVGDFDYTETPENTAKNFTVTKVPGGIGLMTIIMLMNNTLKCAEMREEKKNV